MIPHALNRQSRPGASDPSRRRRRLTRLASVLALPVAAATLVAPTTGASAAAPAAAAAAGSPSPWLPFDLPAKGSLQASSHKVFANWVTSLPISLDNKAPAVDYYQRN